jgi:hypothetical protein
LFVEVGKFLLSSILAFKVADGRSPGFSYARKYDPTLNLLDYHYDDVGLFKVEDIE